MGQGNKYNYRVEINLSDSNTSWTQIVQLVGENKRVLDIGCATGHVDEFLQRNGCTVVGIERDEEFAEQAAASCESVIVGDVERDDLLNRVEGKFDAIVLGDVLEHLLEPKELLKKLKGFIKPDGFIVVSLPNVAFWAVRKNLLFGRFEYSDRGVLDAAHLRFYTLRTAKNLILESGYDVDYVGYRFYFPLSGRKLINKVVYLGGRVPIYLSKRFPSLFAFQFIFRGRPAN